ncbi:MAG: hypothetical protein IKL55_01010 [Clostridia bacterium]|nr:hypothetical protein [Clostridia bacterium]
MKLKKVIIALVFVCCILAIVSSNQVFAESMMDRINNQINTNANGSVVNATKSISGSIITIVQVVCAGVAVAMICMVAIKYMTSAPGEKADIKKHAIVYVVGAVIMFATTGILEIIQNFANSIN